MSETNHIEIGGGRLSPKSERANRSEVELTLKRKLESVEKKRRQLNRKLESSDRKEESSLPLSASRLSHAQCPQLSSHTPLSSADPADWRWHSSSANSSREQKKQSREERRRGSRVRSAIQSDQKGKLDSERVNHSLLYRDISSPSHSERI